MKADDPHCKVMQDWTIEPWTLKVGLLGLDDLTLPQSAQARRHVTDWLAKFQKPSPASAKGTDDTGVTASGFVLVSKRDSTNYLFLGIKMKAGDVFLVWEVLGEDAEPQKGEGPRAHNFNGTMPKLFPAELAAMAELGK